MAIHLVQDDELTRAMRENVARAEEALAGRGHCIEMGFYQNTVTCRMFDGTTIILKRKRNGAYRIEKERRGRCVTVGNA